MTRDLAGVTILESAEGTPMSEDVRAACDAELRRFRWMMLYADRKRLEEGSLDEVARTLLRRSRRVVTVIGIGLVLMVVMRFAAVLSGVTDVQIGIWWIAALGGVHQHSRIETTMQVVLRLLERTDAPRAVGTTA